MFLSHTSHCFWVQQSRRWKHLLPIACLFACLLFCSSCEKVIEVNLDKTEKKYVIEAVLTNQPNTCQVLLSQTKNFDADNVFSGVSGAVVSISGDDNVMVTLNETGAGIYEAPALTGTPGSRYHLSVAIAGELFTATSAMPLPVRFDSLAIAERSFFGEPNRYATIFYTDPPGTGNAYRFVQYVNGEKEPTVFVNNDDYRDGRAVERTLYYFYDSDEEDEKKLKSGDVVSIDMQCIDYAVYKYWYSLDQGATGNSQSATPGNPVTNLEGGALGYFSAHTLENKTILVP